MIRTKSYGFLLELGFILFASLNAYTQDDSEIIRVDTRLVSVDVLVTDKRTGARIDELKREDFIILDDGHPQTLTHFSRGSSAEQPLAIILLIDTSTSMYQSKLSRIRTGLERALTQLRLEDEVAVMTYSPGNKMIQELTRDRKRVLDVLNTIAENQEPTKKRINHTGSDMTAGFLASMRHAQERLPKARMALVVISDDVNDTPKQVAASATVKLLAGGAVVSGLLNIRGKITISNPLSQDENVKRFSEQTGGEIINVRDGDYSSALEQIIGNLAGRYSLGFIPDNARLDGHLHKLTVKVRVPASLGKGRKVEIRTRRGYFAPMESE